MEQEVKVIISQLLRIKEEQEILDREASLLWKTFFEMADKVSGKNKAYRFLDPDTGYVLARIVTLSSAVDEIDLEGKLTHDQWLEITLPKRVLDMSLLETAIKRNHIPIDLLNTCTEAKSIIRKYGPRLASKEELVELEQAQAR